MPGEFKLRPYSEVIQRPLNNAHEQGARALAAALLEVYEMREREFMERRTDKSIVAAGETRRCIHDIHRLVPPKEKA